jgi:sugar lactone lactonase YvrE
MAYGQVNYGHEPYGSPSPLDVCVSQVTGEIAVAETDKLQVAILSSDWKPLRNIPLTQGKPVSITRTPGDNLAVLVSSSDPKVMVYSNDGKLLREFSTDAGQKKLSNPRGIAVDDSGAFYVFDTGNHRVVVFDKNGGFIFEFSKYTWNREFEGKTEAVADQLNTPYRGDFLPDGRLIISDYDGPVVNPKTGQRAGRFSVWSVDVKRHDAQFEQWAFPTVQYETSKAGDVVVDRKTGEIFYCDADFPLTDRDWLKRSSGIGVDPDVEHELYDLTMMTHPCGLAIGMNGEVIVAEADAHLAYAIPRRIFTKDYNQFWPRPQRLVNATAHSVTIEYNTTQPMPSKLLVAPNDAAKYPLMPDGAVERTGEVYNADGILQKDSQARGERHRITLTGLQPGKRYAYRYMVTDRSYPTPLYSKVMMATTQPPKGKTQYAETRVIVLLFSNL